MVSAPKQQRALLENFFNECFKKNQQRGREGRHALTYRECHDVAKEVLAAAQVSHEGRENDDIMRTIGFK